jgi:hypothetical protein
MRCWQQLGHSGSCWLFERGPDNVLTTPPLLLEARSTALVSATKHAYAQAKNRYNRITMHHLV